MCNPFHHCCSDGKGAYAKHFKGGGNVKPGFRWTQALSQASAQNVRQNVFKQKTLKRKCLPVLFLKPSR